MFDQFVDGNEQLLYLFVGSLMTAGSTWAVFGTSLRNFIQLCLQVGRLFILFFQVLNVVANFLFDRDQALQMIILLLFRILRVLSSSLTEKATLILPRI